MNWQQVTQSFLPLSREQTSGFAQPREIDLAIAAYNRAIRNLNQDSVDIALIALRKLSSDYPDFLEANLLYGCCLAQVGQFADAREQLTRTASHPELPEDLAEAAQAAIQAVDQDMAEQAALAAQAATTRPLNGKTDSVRAPSDFSVSDLPVRPADALLEKTGRKARVRMASERERREIMRRSDMPREEETHVLLERSPMDILRIAIPVVIGLVVLVLIVFFATRVLPGIRPASNKTGPEARLTYLLSAIEKKAETDEDWKKLLDDYETYFNPTPTPVATTSAATTTAPTTAVTSQTSAPTETTVAPTQATTQATTAASTAAPTESPAVQSLRSARVLVQEVMTLKGSGDITALKGNDLITVSEKLYQAIALLKAIPADTRADGQTQTAGALLADAQAQYEPIYRYGADELRKLAEPLFDQGKYPEALAYYLRAYQMYPNSYGGGVAYYCGRCYQLMKQPDKSRPYYEYVVANFAGKSIATSAASRLRELG